MINSLSSILSAEPAYRVKQIYKAWFNPAIKNYAEITTLPLELREKLKNFFWLPAQLKIIKKSKADNTEKALLELADGECVETVLMSRGGKKEEGEEKTRPHTNLLHQVGVGGRRTICISSQVGCGMGCVFCATGKLGFKRNLAAEEIIGQFRFWQNRLANPSSREATKGEGGEAIGNIVVMGQGEPLLNYENIKKALNIILENTDIGPSKITISTVGEKTAMGKLLRDKEFPAVRIAISLHSAVEATRKRIVPSTQVGFINFLVKWSEEYHKILGSRSHFLSLEYTLLKNINDDDEQLKALISLARKLGRVKINLIPLNETADRMQHQGSPMDTIKKWHDAIMKAGLTCTIRHSQGADIDAACGQLSNKTIGS